MVRDARPSLRAEYGQTTVRGSQSEKPFECMCQPYRRRWMEFLHLTSFGNCRHLSDSDSFRTSFLACSVQVFRFLFFLHPAGMVNVDLPRRPVQSSPVQPANLSGPLPASRVLLEDFYCSADDRRQARPLNIIGLRRYSTRTVQS